jgi:hypothetical protein
MGRDRAAYMREYRARKRGHFIPIAADDDPRKPEIWEERAFRALARVKDLEEEVRHLKAELAKRAHEPIGRVTAVRNVIGPSGRGLMIEGERFNTRPFTPVPKKR